MVFDSIDLYHGYYRSVQHSMQKGVRQEDLVLAIYSFSIYWRLAAATTS